MSTKPKVKLTTSPSLKARIKELMLVDGWQVVIATPFSPLDDEPIEYFAISAKHKSPVHVRQAPEWESVLLALAGHPKQILLIEHPDPVSINVELLALLNSGHSCKDALSTLNEHECAIQENGPLNSGPF